MTNKCYIITAFAESYSSKKPIKIQSIREEEEEQPEELDDTIQQPPTVRVIETNNKIHKNDCTFHSGYNDSN